MARGAWISVSEYLSSSYRPDCDYVDGLILKRDVGEFDHGTLQLAIATRIARRWTAAGMTQLRELATENPSIRIPLEALFEA
jgi:hypothetical protein